MAGGTTGTSRDTLGPLTDIARALKEWSQTSRSGALQGPTGATGATGATGPTGPQGPQGDPAPVVEWYAGADWRSPLLVSADAGIVLTWDSGTSRVGIGTNIPVPLWYQSGGDVQPERVTIGRGIDFVWDSGTGTISIQTNFEVPSLELYWSDWGSRVTVLSAATATVVYSIDFTDAGRASQTWAIRVEYECILMRQTDPTQMSLSYDSDVVVATYNGSGVPTLLVAHEVTDGDEREWWAGGVPNVTSFQGNVSGTILNVTLSKTGGSDCYAKCRVRKCTEWRLDNW